MKRFSPAVAALLVLFAAVPALAQTRALPEGEIRANGDITFGNALKLGRRDGNKIDVKDDLAVGAALLRDALASSVLTRLSAAQIADVRSGAGAINLAPVLNTILNNCGPSATPPTIAFTAGIYRVDDEVIIQTCPVNIVLEAGAIIRQGAGFPSGKRERGVVRFEAGAAGSSLTGTGTIDGNRAALVGDYLALPKATQANGLYVMEAQWNCVHVNNARAITVRGITLRNCMSFAVNHFGGDDFTASDLTIRDSTAAANGQVGANPSWTSIREYNIGNVVGGVAIPWFAYANVWSDYTNPRIAGISLAGYQALIRDGTSAAPGARIGDPYGGAFMLLRTTRGTVSDLSASGLSYDDGRAVRAAWGFHCDNCTSLSVSGVNSKGFYWPVHFLAPSRVTFTNFNADGDFNTAPVAGAADSACIWVTPNGQMRGNPGLDSSYDHANMMPSNDLVISGGTATRCRSGVTGYTGGMTLNGVRATGNEGPGVLFWAAQAGPGYPASAAFPVRNIQMTGVTADYNGGAGIQFNDGIDIQATGIIASNNGQDSATTSVGDGIRVTPGFGGLKKNIRFTGWTASDTQAEAISARLSFVPGTASGGRYKLVASSTAQLHVGQRILVKNGGGAGSDINVKIADITDDTLTVTTTGAPVFSASACTTALAGTVSVPAGGNIMTGTGTAFSSAFSGPTYVLAAGQYLRIGQVRSGTVAQIDTPAGAAVTNASATLISCPAQGIPSQQTGVNAIADANISDISLGSPSSYQALGNTAVNINVAPGSLRDERVPYAPTFSASDGSGVTFSGGATYRQDGKGICLRGFVQVNYSAAPSAVVVSLPPGLTAFGGAAVAGFNATTNNLLKGIANASPTVTLTPVSGDLVTASGQFLQFNGCLDVQ